MGRFKRAEAAGDRVGADVSDAALVEAAVSRVAEELGPPVVLVNNAGVTRDSMLFKMSDSDRDIVMNVHLRGASGWPARRRSTRPRRRSAGS